MGQTGEPFEIKTGVRQGAILSPLLVNCAIDHVLRKAWDNQPEGVKLYPSNTIVTNLAFADDIALLAECPQDLQKIINRICEEGSKLGLILSSAKSKVITSRFDLANITITSYKTHWKS